MSRQDVIDAARDYARRNPGDLRQRELLARMEGRTLPPLDVGAARARCTAAVAPPRPVQRPAAPPVRPPAPRPAPAAQYAMRGPDRPPGAVQFIGRDNTWRWVHIDPAATDGRQWQRLAAGLVAAGPFQCLRVRRDALPADRRGHALFPVDPLTGAPWVDVVVSAAVPAGRTGPTLAHELAHVADEVVSLERAETVAAWHAAFSGPRRSAHAEAFAVACEDWVTTDTTPAELLAAARVHQEQRRH
ncbi:MULTISPECIES: hypothetical protein [unclassified Streptomyces]|uniref:hypothetical protein n=1 Tax=unclassified Streptomyces TaxID=2593676 RepID=UPI000DABA38A|nr:MULTISPECIES: hypothetical protein [unclassified Streptomyces]PZT74494.1 hypothetical protein DNK55_20545 [Streptomyces sp. AC1-42T]PZT82520.1 hypothetical protein DNK56_10900 [Streptomyces sp. AC1-42W]